MIEIRFELRIFGSDIMFNHYLYKKLKFIKKGKFNHLINTLTVWPPPTGRKEGQNHPGKQGMGISSAR
jgi:hypothetical protein